MGQDGRVGRTRRPAGAGRATWRGLLAASEFRALWLAQAVSLLGDQLARVAVAWLVFRDTGSALLTALVYAVTFVPWLVGGPLLAGLADRFPRRAVIVTGSLLSAALVAAVALPGLPLPVLYGVLFGLVLVESPLLAARSALLVDVLPDDRYVLATAAGNVTGQATQVLGFAAGGGLVAALGPRPALLIDAGTFVLAAVLVHIGVRRRSAAAAPADPSGSASGPAGRAARLRIGWAIVFGDPRLRRLVLLTWLAAFAVVPEGLAAPYAQLLGGGAGTLGLLLTASPAGAVTGALLVTRFVPPDRRIRLLVPLAALSLAPLLGCAAGPGLPVVLATLVLSGLGGSYQLIAGTTVMRLVPAASRGQAFGLSAGGLVAGQGLGLAAAGAVAGLTSPATVTAGAGLLGLILLALLGRQPQAGNTPPAHQPHTGAPYRGPSRAEEQRMPTMSVPTPEQAIVRADPAPVVSTDSPAERAWYPPFNATPAK